MRINNNRVLKTLCIGSCLAIYGCQLTEGNLGGRREKDSVHGGTREPGKNHGIRKEPKGQYQPVSHKNKVPNVMVQCVDKMSSPFLLKIRKGFLNVYDKRQYFLYKIKLDEVDVYRTLVEDKSEHPYFTMTHQGVDKKKNQNPNPIYDIKPCKNFWKLLGNKYVYDGTEGKIKKTSIWFKEFCERKFKFYNDDIKNKFFSKSKFSEDLDPTDDQTIRFLREIAENGTASISALNKKYLGKIVGHGIFTEKSMTRNI